MRTVLEEFGGSIVYVIAGGGFVGIFCYILMMVV
ncbi:hypothetical protein C805_02422 [Eubacterium sp. 14-2]|nr:hypothetical protein C805_02422 [Eubacterium sp. 14-2]